MERRISRSLFYWTFKPIQITHTFSSSSFFEIQILTSLETTSAIDTHSSPASLCPPLHCSLHFPMSQHDYRQRQLQKRQPIKISEKRCAATNFSWATLSMRRVLTANVFSTDGPSNILNATHFHLSPLSLGSTGKRNKRSMKWRVGRESGEMVF